MVEMASEATLAPGDATHTLRHCPQRPPTRRPSVPRRAPRTCHQPRGRMRFEVAPTGAKMASASPEPTLVNQPSLGTGGPGVLSGHIKKRRGSLPASYRRPAVQVRSSGGGGGTATGRAHAVVVVSPGDTAGQLSVATTTATTVDRATSPSSDVPCGEPSLSPDQATPVTLLGLVNSSGAHSQARSSVGSSGGLDATGSCLSDSVASVLTSTLPPLKATLSFTLGRARSMSTGSVRACSIIDDTRGVDGTNNASASNNNVTRDNCVHNDSRGSKRAATDVSTASSGVAPDVQSQAAKPKQHCMGRRARSGVFTGPKGVLRDYYEHQRMVAQLETAKCAHEAQARGGAGAVYCGPKGVLADFYHAHQAASAAATVAVNQELDDLARNDRRQRALVGRRASTGSSFTGMGSGRSFGGASDNTIELPRVEISVVPLIQPLEQRPQATAAASSKPKYNGCVAVRCCALPCVAVHQRACACQRSR